MAMAASEIEQVITLIDRSKAEVTRNFKMNHDQYMHEIELLQDKVERLVQANNNHHWEVRAIGSVALVGFVAGIASLISLLL